MNIHIDRASPSYLKEVYTFPMNLHAQPSNDNSFQTYIKEHSSSMNLSHLSQHFSYDVHPTCEHVLVLSRKQYSTFLDAAKPVLLLFRGSKYLLDSELFWVDAFGCRPFVLYKLLLERVVDTGIWIFRERNGELTIWCKHCEDLAATSNLNDAKAIGALAFVAMNNSIEHYQGLVNTNATEPRDMCNVQAKKLVEWLELHVFYIDPRGYIALKPNATENWQTLCKEVKEAK